MFISVVIITKNSEKHIKECIKSVFLQNYKNFEVIIVDAKSTDDTIKIIYEEMIYSGKSNLVKIIYTENNTSIGKARQIGVENSQGETIAFVDSDVELPHNDWLKNMSKPLKHVIFIAGYGLTDENYINNIAGVQTLAKCKPNDPWILKRVHEKFDYLHHTIDKNSNEIVGTSHILIRKKLIEDVGGFRNIGSAEDLEVTKAIMERGYKFIYLSEEKCYHYHVDGLWHFIKKRWRDKKLAIRRILFERK
jgi:glycosyltransferase involved in cell wall biosynthesis